ncbi:phage portal protein [Lacticaseibacillus daqingensis]|uniref:phage portal protein n=1 Tax=Lacticaseibacillus daqingensis TaxID=2486014 RepID=UPI000F779E23|nr:phage portal protein [Lacticaseibacillus daqingensis]
MTIINPFARFQTRSQVIPSTNFAPFVVSGGKVIPNNMVDARFALQNSDVFAVINLLSSDIASATMSAPEPFLTLLRRPNNLISGYNFWQSVAAQLLLSGNAYVACERDASNIPTRLELAPAGQIVTTLADSNADISYTVNWGDERGKRNYPNANMLHFRLLATGSNESNLYVGISPLQSLAESINMQDFSNRLTLSSLKHALNPSTVLTAAEGALSKDEKEGIRAGWEAANEGENAGRAIVLDQAVTMSSVSINADVAKFLSTLDFGKTQIAKAFGVPDSYLNGQGDQQSSIEMTKSLYANTLRRYTMPIESELFAKFGVTVELDQSAAVDADNTTLVSQIQDLSTGQNPVLSATDAMAMLRKRGVL